MGLYTDCGNISIGNMHMVPTLKDILCSLIWYSCDYLSIPAKTLHNSDTVSVHFNHFYCMGICDKLCWHLYMLTYIYFKVDGC